MSGDFIADGWKAGPMQRVPPSISGLPPTKYAITDREFVIPPPQPGIDPWDQLVIALRGLAYVDEHWTITRCYFHRDELATWEELELAMQEAREQRSAAAGFFRCDGWVVGEVVKVADEPITSGAP